MIVGDRVQHKSGLQGTVKRIERDYTFVAWDGWHILLPYKAEWLKVGIKIKKRINREQILELTEEQQKILVINWIPEVGDYFVDILNDDPKEYYVTDVEKIGKPYLENVPLLTIGNMIEMLQESGMEIFLDGTHWYDKDVCDKLWEDIKRVLIERTKESGK